MATVKKYAAAKKKERMEPRSFCLTTHQLGKSGRFDQFKYQCGNYHSALLSHLMASLTGLKATKTRSKISVSRKDASRISKCKR